MRKWALCALGGVVLSAGVTFVGTGTAFAMPLPANGAANCSITGSGTFLPHLTAAGSSVAEAIKFHGTTGTCSTSTVVTTAGTPVTITGMTVKGVGKLVDPSTGSFANSCTGFNTQDRIAKLKLKVTWTSVPAIAPTKVTYVNGTVPPGYPLGTVRRRVRTLGGNDHHRRLIRHVTLGAPVADHKRRECVLFDVGALCRFHLGTGSYLDFT